MLRLSQQDETEPETGSQSAETAEERRIREAALECLPALRQRVESEPLDHALSVEEQNVLMQELESQFRTWKRNRLGVMSLLILGDFSFIGALFLGLQSGHFNGTPLALMFLGFACLGIALPTSLFMTMGKTNPALDKASECEDIRLVGQILDNRFPKQSDFLASLRILTRLLPRMKASDAKLLTARQRKTLYVFLRQSSGLWLVWGKSEWADFAVAVLRALEQIGDRDAVPIVERLAAQPVNTPEGKRIQAAAIECLPTLRQLVEERRTEEELLRPSEAYEAPPEQLLRAAGSGTASEPAELLRAGESSQQATVEKYPQG